MHAFLRDAVLVVSGQQVGSTAEVILLSTQSSALSNLSIGSQRAHLLRDGGHQFQFALV